MRLLPRCSVVVLLACVAWPVAAAEPVAGDWAYSRFTRPAVPNVREPQSAIRNDIDRFLLAALRDKKLSYAPEADRRTLIRRVYFDLIGLPPTPQQIEAFVNDKDPNAYEKLVEKLLASPQYGERQALFWLDLVRFAETDGFKADDPRPLAWRYRDYVIDSFNADKPFDRFVKEQLAGDELFPDSPEAVIATGYLRHYPDEYNAVNLEQRRYEIITDITDTTASAFLGMTAGCARCHDHKYDPITQKDYFRLQAFFAGYWPTETPLVPGKERENYEKQLAAWEAKTADVRAAIAKLEEPYRKRDSTKQRGRFPDEYASLIDIPFAERTPLQRQIAAMVEKQVYTRGDVSKSMKPTEKEQFDGLKAKLAELAKDKPAEPARALAMTDLATPPKTHLYKRGNWQKPDEEIVPGFLSAIDDLDAKVKSLGTTSGRRAVLANWIASKDNPLTARVIVNRLWQQRFGFGIVRTSSDFGTTGDKPTHPELLDWLASELIAHNWSLKHIHKLIVLSGAYRQGSRGADGSEKTDPDNKLLWQFPRRRLDGETIRDAMLAVTGQLNLKAGGPSIFPEIPAELQKAAGTQWKVSVDPNDRNRRSIYVFVKRNLRYPIFALFDAPDRNETTARRFTTTTAPQALALLNDPLVLNFGKAFAERVTQEVGTDTEKFVDRAFMLAFSRQPATEERTAMLNFLKRHKGTASEATADLCHSLLNLNEFIYID